MHNSAITFQDGYCSYQQRPLPSTGKGLRIEVLSAGLCGTDIQILNGIRHEQTDIIGHEGIGIVADNYQNSSHTFGKGQRVIINPTDAHSAAFLLGHNTPGLFQQYVTIPDEAVSNGVVLAVNTNISKECASLIEPVAVAITALDAVQDWHPKNILIIGAGIVGNLIGMIATLRNPLSRITIIHHSSRSLVYSKIQLLPQATHLFGAEAFTDELQPKDTAVFVATPRNATNTVISKVLEHFKSSSVIDVIGGFNSQALINAKPATALFSLRAANICMKGKEMQNLPVFPHYSDNQQLSSSAILSHRGVSNIALINAMSLINAHQNKFRKVVTHVFPFTDFAEFLNTLISSDTRIINDRYVLKSVMLNNKVPQ
ncbi:alcohol dehydrogenase catalytic domain-containing protein [Serratia sp. (in: enterobacteria)]|uniref:alcohol dehydrogenase catalytic domain-containing protein n=1 Tax=Serratia sp. (in: enterobacteria) TaxID=616 RepID=UPI003989D0F9